MRRIKNARVLTARLGHALISKERKAIRKELYNFEQKKHTRTTRERAIAYLTNLQRKLEDKLKYSHVD